jgi:hypothetical protein
MTQPGAAALRRVYHRVYEEIARDARDCVVVEVPVGVRTGTDRIGRGEALTFYQTVRRKRLVNGFVARGPLAALDYYRASPALMFLAHEPAPPGDRAADLRQKIHDLDACYIVVHPEMMEAAWVGETVQLLTTLDGLTRIDTGDALVAFRVGSAGRASAAAP